MYDWDNFYKFLQVEVSNAEAFLALILNNKELFLDFYRNNPLGLDDKLLDKFAKKVFVKHLFSSGDADVVEKFLAERVFKYGFFACNIENAEYDAFWTKRNESLVSSEKELMSLVNAIAKAGVPTAEQKNKAILSIFEKYKQYIPKISEEMFDGFEHEYFVGFKTVGDFYDFYQLFKDNGAEKEVLLSIGGRLFYAGRHGCKNEVLIKILQDDELLSTPQFEKYMFEFLSDQKSTEPYLVYQNMGHFFKKRFNKPYCLDLIESFIGVYKTDLNKHIVNDKKNKKFTLTLDNLISFWRDKDVSMRDYSILLSKLVLVRSIPDKDKQIKAIKI